MANNSISQIIRQFLEMNQNSLENYEKISEAITTDKKTVSLDLFDDKGNLKTVQVPAFGYLKREIERLDQNFKSISGIGSADASVRLADGTYRKIQKSKLKSPAKSVTSVDTPREFTAKTNNFFESFLNPLLQVNLNVNGQVPTDVEKIKLRRYIIDANDVASTEWFDDNIRGLDSLEVNQMVSDLATAGIKYIVDEEIIDAPVRSARFYGGFNVTNVRTAQRTLVVDGVSQTKTVKLYTLDKLTYSDADKSMAETESLKVNDELLVNSGNNSTKYRVIAINTDTLEVELLLLEGYEAIKIGANQLKIYKNKEAYDSIEINIGFDERMVAFIKPVDPESNFEAEVWSPGTAFYTNDLVITRLNGEVQSLADYYKEEVADFGQFIKALKDDAIPPSTVGVAPDAPQIDAESFKVVQVNTHLTNNSSFTKVQELSSNKISTQAKISRLDDDLAKKRSEIATKKYSSSIERDRDRNELTSMLNERAAESSLYSSLVNEIKSVASDSAIQSIAPKYRVRGFFPMPVAKLAGNTIPQEVVQFKIQYRYLSQDGTPSDVNQIETTDNGSRKTGVFSNWIEVNSKARKRIKDEITGKYIWATEAIENGQEVNINQIDIPIQAGEVVEFRVKSLSEAGWPANPVESEWSDITRIEFPADAQANESVVSLIEENSKEIAKVSLVSELQSAGMYVHINDSFQANEKYFAHEAQNIASGFLTNEQSPINLFEKLTQMQNEINALKEQIAGTVGELAVKIQYEDGRTEIIQNNTVKSIFAGYYTDEVKDLTIKKGHIVTKTFKILLENSKATPLELISRLAGDRKSAVYASSINSDFGVEANVTSIDSAVANDSYYLSQGKYDLAPVIYQNTSAPEFATESFLNEAPNQSGQLKGQFAYSRFRNISNSDNLYTFDDLAPADITGAIVYESSIYDLPSQNYGDAGVNYFIWNGKWNGANGAPGTIPASVVDTAGQSYDNGIHVHVNHPALQTTNIWNDIYQDGAGIVHAKSAKFNNTQTAYFLDLNENRTVKMAFDPNDQYLLGGKSCGSYLFLSPLSIESLSVDADNSSGKFVVRSGENNAIAIDVIFQYRMTDYAGTSDSNLGFIGGISTSPVSNLTYSKKIGLDILDADNNKFSFDLEVFAKYTA
jgi:hypothetical protein